MSTNSFDPAGAGWEILPDRGFIDLVGPLWIREQSGGRSYGFLAEPKHVNRIGVVQGGMLMTFADRAMGLSAWEAMAQRPCVTVQFDAQFVTSARIGEFVEAQCEVVRRARTLVFMRGTLLADSRVVATASGVWKLLGGRSRIGAGQ